MVIREYIETIVEGLTEEELKSCLGISLSSACSGIGFVNRAEMIYSVKEFQIPLELKKNIHLLGVGSHEMLTPFFVSPEYFDFVENVSYDSSTQANSWFFSRYRDTLWVNTDLDSPATTTRAYDDLYRNQLVPVFSELFELNKSYFSQWNIPSFDFLIQECTKWSLENTEKERLYNTDKGKDGAKLLPFFWQMQVVENFMTRVNDMVNNPSSVPNRGLSNIKDYKQFVNDWLPLQGSQDKLEESFSGSLDGFFS